MKLPLFALLLSVLAPCAFAAEFHVSPKGLDTNPGSADKPFATLEHARDAARAAGGKNTVVLEPGAHRLTKTFELDAKDSGTLYKGKPGARITGSMAIPNAAVKPVTDPMVLERLCPEVRGKVLEIDLKALGISDFGDLGPRGFRRPYIPAPLELIANDAVLNVAQWPNQGEPGEPIGRVLSQRTGKLGGTFLFKCDRPSRWTKAQDVWLTGYFKNGYADDTLKVASFDLSKKSITTSLPHMWGFGSGKPFNRWTALNLLEEIDRPGEFVADKPSGKAYFLPPEKADIATFRLEATILKDPLIAIEGATGVVLDGLVIEASRGIGVYIERGAENRIQNCTLRNLGIVAVCIGKGIAPDTVYRKNFTGVPASRMIGSLHEHIYDNTAHNRDGGTGHRIVNCIIHDIGAGGISLGGGDRKSLTPAGNAVENCEIYDFNRWDKSYKSAVNIEGVGNRISHCLIHHCPGSALYLHGNDHVVEYNEIHHAMMKGEEMGAFYMGRDPSEYGNVFRFNFLHDIGNPEAGGHGCLGLHLDDGSCGLLVEGNVFFRIPFATGLNGGYNHRFINNLFVDIPNPLKRNAGIRAGFTPATWIAYMRTPLLAKRLHQSVDILSPPYSERYPDLKALYELPASARHFNTVHNNVFVRAGDDKSPRPDENPQGNDLKDNFATQEDPGFMDIGKMDFRLREDSVVFRKIPGFKAIPFEKIGLEKKP